MAMADMGGVRVTQIPPSVVHLIAVNLEYAVLLCTKPQCRHAQAVRGIEEHLRRFHHEKPAIRKEAVEFGRALVKWGERFLYDYTVVELPVNGLAPQPIVPVVDGFSCYSCCFLTISRAVVRKHVNKEHLRQDKENNRIFGQVRLQSWYGPKRERYWVVDEGTDGIGNSAKRALEDAAKGSNDVAKPHMKSKKASSAGRPKLLRRG